MKLDLNVTPYHNVRVFPVTVAPIMRPLLPGLKECCDPALDERYNGKTCEK